MDTDGGGVRWGYGSHGPFPLRKYANGLTPKALDGSFYLFLFFRKFSLQIEFVLERIFSLSTDEYSFRENIFHSYHTRPRRLAPRAPRAKNCRRRALIKLPTTLAPTHPSPIATSTHLAPIHRSNPVLRPSSPPPTATHRPHVPFSSVLGYARAYYIAFIT